MEMEEVRRRMGPLLLPGNGGGGSSRRMRKPLSDCTNTARNSSQSSSSYTASVLKPQPKPDFSVPHSNSRLCSKTSKTRARNPSPSPVAAASAVPPRPPTKSASASAQIQGRAVQNARTEGKTAMVPVSSSLTKRNRRTGDKLDQGEEGSISKSCALPKKRKQHCKREEDDSKKAFEDYIQQQRSYYAEIDAFELPEEEVDSIAALE
ncbi:serine/arginine repetitive matrix protein 1-like isoform X2 [Punica granatum]|uniref:Serine/arginine repetitive matrix protein 1-like isoform X2 n=1 Tax=Punica granatum TaxID=22663 RepID=A0A6P8BYX7_PUNGR|nr:serine/arginine repetitive matrix protein 1-like isoform X2 [Punica granatum]